MTQAGLGVSSFVQACPAGHRVTVPLCCVVPACHPLEPASASFRNSYLVLSVVSSSRNLPSLFQEPPFASLVLWARPSRFRGSLARVCIGEGRGRRRHALLGLLGRHLYARGGVGCAEGTRRGC